MEKTVHGKIVYQDLETGFWGIVDKDGNQYRPINMPEQLKSTGASVRVRIREVEEEMSLFMWGTPVEIVSFYTINDD